MAGPLHSAHMRKPRLSPYPELDLAIKLVGSGDIGGKVLFDEIPNSVCAAPTTHQVVCYAAAESRGPYFDGDGQQQAGKKLKREQVEIRTG